MSTHRMKTTLLPTLRQIVLPLFALALLAQAGCSTLGPTKTAPPVFYALNDVTARPAPVALASTPVLLVTPTRAAAGFDSQRIIYLREAHKLEYFANSEWAEPPARMLGPLLVAALERSAAFRAVVSAGGSAAADYRLDTELIRLQQDFLTRPSSVRFELRAMLIEDRSRRVVAVRQFQAAVAAESEDPYGGVKAANSAVHQVLTELAAFCADAVPPRPVTK